MAQFEIKWQAPEFRYHPKLIGWYWLSVIFAVIIIGLAVWQKNFLFGLFVLIAEVLILVWGNRQPPLIEFNLNEKGLLINHYKFHPYGDMVSYSVDETDEEWPEIHWQFRSRFQPRLTTLVPKEQIESLRQTLAPFIQEIEHQNSLLDALSKFIKF